MSLSAFESSIGRNLVENRLEHMVIYSVDQNHIGPRSTESLGGGQPPQASAHDDDSR
jgi:hypothetical protein